MGLTAKLVDNPGINPLFDNLGGRLGIWVFVAALISVFSYSPKLAAGHPIPSENVRTCTFLLSLIELDASSPFASECNGVLFIVNLNHLCRVNASF